MKYESFFAHILNWVYIYVPILTGEHKFAPDRKKPMKEPMSFTNYKKVVGRYLYSSKVKMIGEFNGRYDESDMDNIMRHFHRAMGEMSLFFNYYEDISHQDKVDRKELGNHCGMRDKSSMFLSPVFKNQIFLCSF